jgi:hypothetical protein
MFFYQKYSIALPRTMMHIIGRRDSYPLSADTGKTIVLLGDECQESR